MWEHKRWQKKILRKVIYFEYISTIFTIQRLKIKSGTLFLEETVFVGYLFGTRFYYVGVYALLYIVMMVSQIAQELGSCPDENGDRNTFCRGRRGTHLRVNEGG